MDNWITLNTLTQKELVTEATNLTKKGAHRLQNTKTDAVIHRRKAIIVFLFLSATQQH